MAITLSGIALSIEEMFANIRPATDKLMKLGSVDFSDAAPAYDIKPGATVKVPLSTIAAASAFNTSSNHYGTGGATSFGDLTATHYLQGFDLSGEDLDKGVNASRMKNLFARRAGGFGSIARVPSINADYTETGTETDPESGLSVGIVVNSDRNLNRQIVNADLWFGVITVKSPANASTAGCIKIT